LYIAVFNVTVHTQHSYVHTAACLDHRNNYYYAATHTRLTSKCTAEAYHCMCCLCCAALHRYCSITKCSAVLAALSLCSAVAHVVVSTCCHSATGLLLTARSLLLQHLAPQLLLLLLLLPGALNAQHLVTDLTLFSYILKVKANEYKATVVNYSQG
jgi:hypothetical protein